MCGFVRLLGGMLILTRFGSAINEELLNTRTNQMTSTRHSSVQWSFRVAVWKVKRITCIPVQDDSNISWRELAEHNR